MASALLAALVALPACALERGQFVAGVYTAPGQLFTVKSPLGPDPQLIDTFERGTGAVTFLDERGRLFGVVCTPNLDILSGADNDFETDAAILRNWLRDATLPMFFERMVPGSSILREEPAIFEGLPAWVAVLHLPQGSTMFLNDPETGPTRQDSWRGVVVFSRAGQTYLIMTEAALNEPGVGRRFDASASGWNDFVAPLSEFYRGMSFDVAPAELAETPVSDAQHAGT
jgi:hypothetical protein